MNRNVDDINLIKLRNISNEMELGMIKAILNDNNIPFILRDHGPGAYMRLIGRGSIYGTDIMVEEADFDKANSLLESTSI